MSHEYSMNHDIRFVPAKNNSGGDAGETNDIILWIDSQCSVYYSSSRLAPYSNNNPIIVPCGVLQTSLITNLLHEVLQVTNISLRSRHHYDIYRGPQYKYELMLFLKQTGNKIQSFKFCIDDYWLEGLFRQILI